MKEQYDDSEWVDFEWPDEQEEQVEIRRVVLKFENDKRLPYSEAVVKHLDGWAEIEEEFPGISIAPLCISCSAEDIERLVNEARELDPDYEESLATFLNLYGVDYPENTDAEALAERLGSAWEFAEFAYAEGVAPPPPAVNPGNDPHRPRQRYLDRAPVGIDAEAAWQVTGGDGAAVHFVDIERGWCLHLGHEDLPAEIHLVSGQDETVVWKHGTAVLGVVVGKDNARGIIGIAPNVARVSVVSQRRANGKINTHDAILSALQVMGAGDVLLLEAQATADRFPIEWYPHIRRDIRLATARGIIVVEAAGNGGQDLDIETDGAGKTIWKKGNQFRDSRAIMVGAARVEQNPATPIHTNQGSRIDCFAWGSGVTTTTLNPNDLSSKNWYTGNFGRTSAAAAIVAGAAAVLQGIALANPGVNGGRPFTPLQMRALLTANTGTPSDNPNSDRIGVMPNLRAILAGFNLP